MKTTSRAFLALGLALTLILGSCGGDTDTVTTVEAAEVVETTLPATTVAETTVVESTVPETTLPPVPEFDVVLASAEFLNGIPDGFLSVGDLDIFKEAMGTGGAYVIDVREVSEYEAGHIPGAVNIPIRELTSNLGSIPLDGPVFVYCASGYRAAMSTAALHMLGYTNVKAYGPSYKAWEAAGEDISTEATEMGTFLEPIITDELLVSVDDFISTIPEGYLNLGTVEKMQEAIEAGVYIIDVRETGEYAEGRIPGAVSIPLRTLLDHPEAIPTDTQVVVYCKSGFRAALANATLHIAGYDNVRAFSPSWNAWSGADLEIES